MGRQTDVPSHRRTTREGPAGNTFPTFLWVGLEQKWCVCRFQDGAVKSLGLVLGPGRGLEPMDHGPHLGTGRACGEVGADQ